MNLNQLIEALIHLRDKIGVEGTTLCYTPNQEHYGRRIVLTSALYSKTDDADGVVIS